MTYQKLLNRMLQSVASDVDKREGSILYDALAPAAAQLCQMYLQLEGFLKETFADTASRPYLIKRAKERGIKPYPATQAVVKGVFNCSVPIGSRFSLEESNYIVTALLSEKDHSYQLACETAGSAANHLLGKITPINYIKGLTTAEIVELWIPGEDEEETEVFRQRYLNSLVSQAYGGNIQDYKEKVSAIAGVGGVKVYPVWKGGGTVRLVIINSSFTIPTPQLVNTVQELVDPEQNQGKGYGIAPIGHVVTVEGAKEQFVDVSMVITYQSGWSFLDMVGYLEKLIDDYFQELNEKWAQNNAIVIRTSQIESRVLELEGVLDVSHTKLNGIEENLVLDSDFLAKRGDISG